MCHECYYRPVCCNFVYSVHYRSPLKFAHAAEGNTLDAAAPDIFPPDRDPHNEADRSLADQGLPGTYRVLDT